MATNEIQVFGQGAGANQIAQAQYVDDPQRIVGHQPGVARAQLQNKANLQATAVAAGVAQFLANFQGTNVTDQLTPQNFSDMFKAALNAAGVFTTQSPGDASTRPATCAFVQATVGAAINAGAVVHFPGTSAPPGYVKANGALLSRTTYANLWAYAQSSGNLVATDAAWSSGVFSPGDGSTTFRIPDLRGYHFRSWDDARGLDSGRVIGSTQGDALSSHSHGVNDPTHAHSVYDPGHAHAYNDPRLPVGGSSSYQNGPQATAWRAENIGANSTSASGTGVAIYAASTGISIQAAGSANEVRVKNVAMLACIKY